MYAAWQLSEVHFETDAVKDWFTAKNTTVDSDVARWHACLLVHNGAKIGIIGSK